MGQDCPSVLLYMMHSNNNNIYRWREGDTSVGRRLQRFEGRESHWVHVEVEILFSGVASHSRVYWCPLFTCYSIARHVYFNLFLTLYILSCWVLHAWGCRPSVHAHEALKNIEYWILNIQVLILMCSVCVVCSVYVWAHASHLEVGKHRGGESCNLQDGYSNRCHHQGPGW